MYLCNLALIEPCSEFTVQILSVLQGLAELIRRKKAELWLGPSLALSQGNVEGIILMVVFAYPLGLLGYILYASTLQPLIGKPVLASHLALTSFRLCEGASLTCGLAVILVFRVSKAQQFHISPHQT